MGNIEALSKEFILQISYYVSSDELSDTVKYPYFARTMKSTGLFIPAMVRVLKYYNWNKVAMITETLDYVTSVRDGTSFYVG